MKAVFDIETSMGLFWTYAHNTYEAQLSREHESIKLMVVCVKPLGKKVQKYALIDYPDYKSFLEDVREKVFDRYEVLIAHNGKKFDLRQCNTFFAEVGLSKCKKFPKNLIDTLTESRREFNLPSYSLKFLLRHFKLGIEKIQTGGEDLWFECMTFNPDGTPAFPEAWKKMIRYCSRDVVATEIYYNFLEKGGWVKVDPERIWYMDDMECPKCNRTQWQRRGTKPLEGLGRFQYYACSYCNKQLPGEMVEEW